jgi:flap endonuclease-1
MGVALRDIISDYKTPLSWESLAGIAAVDAHNALYQFLSIIRQPDGTPLMDQKGRITSHLSGILFRTVNFIEKGIRPVYVFDGKPPEFKQETIDQRRSAREQAWDLWKKALDKGEIEEAYRQARSSSRVNEEVISSSKELLSLLGLPYVEAPSEGEAQGALMVRRGDARYVVSQDYDTLLFGGPVLMRNLTVSGKRKVHGRTVSISPERIILSDVLNGLMITREDLIRISILVGTDFNSGVKGIGAKTALKLIKNNEFERVAEEKLPDTDVEKLMAFFLDPPVTEDYSLIWRESDREGVIRMLVEGYDFTPERVGKALDGLKVKAGQKTLDSWFS